MSGDADGAKEPWATGTIYVSLTGKIAREAQTCGTRRGPFAA